jgi:hypothetical protein
MKNYDYHTDMKLPKSNSTSFVSWNSINSAARALLICVVGYVCAVYASIYSPPNRGKMRFDRFYEHIQLDLSTQRIEFWFTLGRLSDFRLEDLDALCRFGLNTDPLTPPDRLLCRPVSENPQAGCEIGVYLMPDANVPED